MATDEWNDVHALQQMLQSVQDAPDTPKLSEQNCVELVQKLIQYGLIELIHTLDGKEYVTPDHLTLEIQEETLSQGGRASLLMLQETLNVDISYIQKYIAEITKRDNKWLLIQGDFIHRQYLDKWCEELNDNLQEAGFLHVTEICMHHNFTKDFVLSQVQHRLGHSIQGHIEQQNSDIIYTDGYIESQKSCIRGLLNGTTQPMKLNTIINLTTKEETLFHTVYNQLKATRQINGSLRGSIDSAVYIPNFYIEAQEKWVNSFIQDNGYIDYARIIKSRIPDPISFIQKTYETVSYFQFRKKACRQLDIEKRVFILLDSVCISNQVLAQIESNVENVLDNGEWVDISSIAPPIFRTQDCVMLLQLVTNGLVNIQFRKYCDTFLASEVFVEILPSKFKEVIDLWVQRVLRKSTHHNELFQILTGRESKFKVLGSKPKKVKGKGKRNAKFHEQEIEYSTTQYQYSELEFMNTEQISAHLSTCYLEMPNEFIHELSTYLEEPLTSRYHSALLDAISAKTKGHISIVEVYNQLTISWYHSCIFKQTIDASSGIPVEIFMKYLLSTICTETVNILVYLLVKEFCHEVIDEPKKLTEAKRMKLITLLKDKQKPIITQLSKSLVGKEFEAYFHVMQSIIDDHSFALNLEFPNAKKVKSLSSGLVDTFTKQLKEEKDYATVLHLATAILYSNVTGYAIHSPGKGVPHLLDFLANHIPEEKMQVLRKCQSLVIKKMVHSKAREKWDLEEDYDQETLRLTRDLTLATDELKSMIIWA